MGSVANFLRLSYHVASYVVSDWRQIYRDGEWARRRAASCNRSVDALLRSGTCQQLGVISRDRASR